MTKFYPMIFEPVFKKYIWGGRKLKKLGRNLPDGKKVAESWEIAAHEDGMSVVKNGYFSGKSLGELLNLFGSDLVGENSQWALERNKFPLLVKLIDANQPLSVQVHPDDQYARLNESNELGKTEMWVILDAEPDAEIIYGLKEYIEKESFRKAIDDGTLGQYLHRVKIKPGDHVCVPSGTLHAILEGALLAEIQQNSNTTYRVFDWNRLAEDGNPRSLHIEKALDVIDFNQVRYALPETNIILEEKGIIVEELCRNDYFSTERYKIGAGTSITGVCDGKTLEIWGLLSGKVSINGMNISGIQFVLLPARMGFYKIEALFDSTLLKVFVS